MIRATWNGAVLAESDRTIKIEGHHYFPPETVRHGYLQASPGHTRCFWKGVASYYEVIVDGKVNHDAAWYYPNPSRAASRIEDHVAFWHGVRIERVSGGSRLSRLLRR